MEAMKVEMALLADLTTYHLAVKVNVKDDALELEGQVPDETCRQHTLDVARQACFLPVRDALTVLAAGPGHPLPPVVLRKAVSDVLIRHLGPAAAAFDIQVQPNGQVCLRGQVASLEEKLTASRCLAACRAVRASSTASASSQRNKAIPPSP